MQSLSVCCHLVSVAFYDRPLREYVGDRHMPKVTSGENTVCPLEPQKSYLISSYM